MRFTDGSWGPSQWRKCSSQWPEHAQSSTQQQRRPTSQCRRMRRGRRNRRGLITAAALERPEPRYSPRARDSEFHNRSRRIVRRWLQNREDAEMRSRESREAALELPVTRRAELRSQQRGQRSRGEIVMITGARSPIAESREERERPLPRSSRVCELASSMLRSVRVAGLLLTFS